MSPAPPLEISEAIIDHLRSDKPALYACSLTCRSWVHASRSHIFSKIDLYPWNFLNFLEVLQSSTSPGRHVRQLILNEGRGRFEVEPRWTSGAAPVLAACLPGLKQLCIRQMQWDLLDQAAQAGIIAGFKNVENLDLHHANFPTLAQTFEFISSFPSLNELSCDVVYWPRTEDTPAGQIRPPPFLHSVRLGLCLKEHFVRWLLSEELRIHTLDLTLISRVQTRSIGNLLSRLGPNLQHLKIGGLSDFTQREAEGELRILQLRNVMYLTPLLADVLTNEIDLAHNISLRSLHLDGLIVHGSSGNHMSLGWIPIILSQIISSQVDEIRFSFWLNVDDELDAINWAQIQHILQHTRFFGRTRLVFFIYGKVDRGKAKESITRRLSALDAQDLVLFG